MNFTPSPLQALVIFRLLFTGYEPKLSEEKQLKRKSRDELIQAGFLELEKRGRSQHIRLTDKAWDWAAHNLDTEISPRARTVDAFQALLSKLKEYLSSNETPLVEFLLPRSSESPLTEEAGDNVEELIREAYYRLSKGQDRVRVRLKDLRANLQQVDRLGLDKALLELQNQGRLVLMHMDDPQERTLADEEAALTIVGQKRHIVYMG